MAKKIYDIVPPGKSKKTEEPINSFVALDKKKRSKNIVQEVVSEKPSRKSKSIFCLKNILLASAVIVFAVAVFLFFELPKAEITIWPKTQILSFSDLISVDEAVSSVSLENKIIPAKFIEKQMDSTQEFKATGNASNEGKAEGTIIIYNKANPSEAVTLKAGTHFLSDSGKYFITLKRVTIPASKTQSGKLVPGSIEADVVAVDSGDTYNIGPATFSVPKLAGTAYYYSTYAESSSAMKGGFSGNVKKIIDDDIESAKNSVSGSLLADIISGLKSEVPEGYVLVDDTIFSEITDSSPSEKSGTITDGFNYQASATASGIIFKKSDLDKFAKDFILSQLEKSDVLLDSSLDVTYTPVLVDLKEGKMSLDINFSAKTYQSIDKNSLVSLFAGKSEAQISDAVAQSLGDAVSKTNVYFWPFWVKNAPRKDKAISVELKFD